MNLDFFVCEHCGNIVVKVINSAAPIVCCGEKMKKLEAASVDAAVEKHVPVVTIEGQKIEVRIGEVPHPMMEEHFIMFVAVETKKGFQIAKLYPGYEPVAKITIADDDEFIAAYEYCNLHGLWKNN